jgi:hypothetical protein
MKNHSETLLTKAECVGYSGGEIGAQARMIRKRGGCKDEV